MGLIRAGIGAMGGTLADQWKEFFYCDSMGKDVLKQYLGKIIYLPGTGLLQFQINLSDWQIRRV